MLFLSRRSLLALLAAGVARPVVAAEGPAARPAPGAAAPAFSAPASNGKTVTLADFKGKQGVILAFFPKAFTGG